MKSVNTAPIIKKYFDSKWAGLILNIQIIKGKPKKGKENANIFGFVKFAHKNSAKRTVRFSQDVEKKNLNAYKVKIRGGPAKKK